MNISQLKSAFPVFIAKVLFAIFLLPQRALGDECSTLNNQPLVLIGVQLEIFAFFFFFKPPACPPGYFKCSTGLCIQQMQRCDGVNNCFDESDELFCGLYSLIRDLDYKTH